MIPTTTKQGAPTAPSFDPGCVRGVMEPLNICSPSLRKLILGLLLANSHVVGAIDTPEGEEACVRLTLGGNRTHDARVHAMLRELCCYLPEVRIQILQVAKAELEPAATVETSVRGSRYYATPSNSRRIEL